MTGFGLYWLYYTSNRINFKMELNDPISNLIGVKMHEIWLQKYIQEHHRQIGFSDLHGPYKYGADFKGLYAGHPVKIEAEWEYTDYIAHGHTLQFADVLVVADLAPVPQGLKEKLPSIIVNLDRAQVTAWAQPRLLKKNGEDYHAYPWRKFARNLLYLYAFHHKQSQQRTDFAGSRLAQSMSKFQRPAGFHFGTGGKEESFEGLPEDKAAWDFWLGIAHTVAVQFHLKPALLRPTWIDRTALYVNNTGRITASESERFQDVALFIDDLLLKEEHP
jgi:hypothetical protein